MGEGPGGSMAAMMVVRATDTLCPDCREPARISRELQNADPYPLHGRQRLCVRVGTPMPFPGRRACAPSMLAIHMLRVAGERYLLLVFVSAGRREQDP
jgi:hypothetical protein